MYSTCLFCHSALEGNETIEHFRVGRRLAFDPERGRLWVVCRRCRQWNLTPTEERWEAIEECERLYRETRLRASTDQIGLARLPSGIELVRIGRPMRPEFAAWRYGDQLGRRRRSALIKAGVGIGALGALVVGGVAAGVGIGSFGWAIGQMGEVIVAGPPNRLIARVRVPDVGDVTVRRKHLAGVQLVNAGDTCELWLRHQRRMVAVRGEHAVQLLGKLLPQINRFGGTRDHVSRAVALLERDGDPRRFIDATARQSTTAKLCSLPDPTRLALEMAAHEESERRALDGELALLEQAWKEAEEVAAIADNMFLPSFVDDWMRRHRQG